MLGDESITLASTNLLGTSIFEEEQNAVPDKEKNSSPPSNIIVKDHFTTEDYETMLQLAREKFDELRRMNRGRGNISSRYSRPRTSTMNQNQMKITRLLSSLLYLSLMMNKVDDMKRALEHRDCALYREWEGLFTSLHSPLFHLKERSLQNERSKKIYNRKLRYKNLHNETKATLDKASETSKEMSETILKLTESNSKLQSQLETHFDLEKSFTCSEAKIESLKKSLDDKMDLLRASEAMKKTLQSTVSELQSDKSVLLKKTEEDSARIYDLSEGNDYLKNALEEKNNQIMTLKEKLIVLEEQQKATDVIYKAESIKYEDTILKLRQDLDEKVSTTQHCKVENEKSTQSCEAHVRRLEEESRSLTVKVSTAESELKSCKLELEMIKKNLHLKDMEIEKAKEEVQLQTNHQNKWRESIAQKDQEISKLYIALRDMGTNKSQPNSENDREMYESRLKTTLEDKLKEFLMENARNLELERQLKESKLKESQLAYEKDQLKTQIKNISVKDNISEKIMNELRNINGLLNVMKNEQGKLACPKEIEVITLMKETDSPKEQSQIIVEHVTNEAMKSK
jgi:chromosome segregation ATPase